MSIKCEICNNEISKYKCPKCFVRYCSVKCFKDHEMNHKSEPETPINRSPEICNEPINTTKDKYEYLLADESVRLRLKSKSLQYHLGMILKILNDDKLTKEKSYEQRKELAVNHFQRLRIGGDIANEEVEEFSQLLLSLMNQ
ncbi:hypothetical protein CANCADRAFT_24016 [Tortispora caseinolytica NRRL Y-17796]|uniref:HIT-type domain-containing protein n=1 Tax=Tortispora caseinolytica NRRL Y-17796 TaxID=767744 RepID=A0A1E4TFZ7_9ASCO|nr:hypothetical protein CANCADRAFT_24016 [Tortispora caseinolytica NRRL Y-17796]